MPNLPPGFGGGPLSLSDVLASGHSWKHIWGQGEGPLVSQQGAQGFIWLPSGAWKLPQILQLSEITPLLLQGPRKLTEPLIFCFPSHITVVAFWLSSGRFLQPGAWLMSPEPLV